MYVRGEYDFRRLGIRAASQRYARTPGATVGDGAPWISSYSRRKAYVLEVNRRMDSLWKDIYQSHVADDDFRAEFRLFLEHWQKFVEGLSVAGMLLPSTEDYAQRVDEQIEQWRRRFEALGGKTDIPDYMPPPSAGEPFPWKRLFAVITVVAVAGGIIFIAGKLPDVPGPRYS